MREASREEKWAMRLLHAQRGRQGADELGHIVAEMDDADREASLVGLVAALVRAGSVLTMQAALNSKGLYSEAQVLHFVDAIFTRDEDESTDEGA
jgi:hypothetical protein